MRQFLSSLVKFILLNALAVSMAQADLQSNGKPQFTVLVTGAFRGLGLEIGKDLLEAGHFVVFSGRKIADLPPEIANNPNAMVIEMDMANEASIESGFAQVIEKRGRVDVVIHNAGLMVMESGHLVAGKTLGNATNVNFLGPVHLTQLALPYFKQQKFGRVVYLSSAVTIMRERQLGVYAATKSAAESFFRTMAKDVRHDPDYENVDLDISVLRLNLIRGDYTPHIQGSREVTQSARTELMAWMRNHSPTTPSTVSGLISETIHKKEAPEFVNVGLDGKLLKAISILPDSVQSACSNFLMGAINLVK